MLTDHRGLLSMLTAEVTTTTRPSAIDRTAVAANALMDAALLGSSYTFAGYATNGDPVYVTFGQAG